MVLFKSPISALLWAGFAFVGARTAWQMVNNYRGGSLRDNEEDEERNSETKAKQDGKKKKILEFTIFRWLIAMALPSSGSPDSNNEEQSERRDCKEDATHDVKQKSIATANEEEADESNASSDVKISSMTHSSNTNIHNDENNKEVESMLARGPDEQSEVVAEQFEVVEKQLEIVNEESEVTVLEESEVANDQSEVANEQSEVVDKQSEVVTEQAEVVDGPKEVVQEQSEVVTEQSEVQSEVVSKQSEVADKQNSTHIENLDNDITASFEVEKKTENASESLGIEPETLETPSHHETAESEITATKVTHEESEQIVNSEQNQTKLNVNLADEDRSSVDQEQPAEAETIQLIAGPEHETAPELKQGEVMEMKEDMESVTSLDGTEKQESGTVPEPEEQKQTNAPEFGVGADIEVSFGDSPTDDDRFEEIASQGSRGDSSSSSKFSIIDIMDDDVVTGEAPENAVDVISYNGSNDEVDASMPDQTMTSLNAEVTSTNSSRQDVSFTAALVEVTRAGIETSTQRTETIDARCSIPQEDGQNGLRNVASSSEQSSEPPAHVINVHDDEGNGTENREPDVILQTMHHICDSVAEAESTGTPSVGESTPSTPHIDSVEPTEDQPLEKGPKENGSAENLHGSFILTPPEADSPEPEEASKTDEETTSPQKSPSQETPSKEVLPQKAPTRKAISPDGPPPFCSLNFQLKLFYTGSHRQTDTAVIEDTDTCDLKVYIKSVETLKEKIKSKVYIKIMLRNDEEGLSRRKAKTRLIKTSSSSLPIHKTMEFGKVPRKMLNGRLQVAMWTSGGLGANKQLCSAEISFKSKENFGNSDDTTWCDKLLSSKGQWVDGIVYLR